jgi:hypothetical protein
MQSHTCRSVFGATQVSKSAAFSRSPVLLALLVGVLWGATATKAAIASDASNHSLRSAAPVGQTVMVAQAQSTPTPLLEQAVGEDGMTPVQKSLPDPASNEELQGERGTTLFVLILGGAMIAAAVLALLFFFTRRSWSTHP